MAETTTGTREARLRTVAITYFPMFIAVLSLVTSIYNGYLNGRFVGFIERNASRLEYIRTCRDVIEAYFQVKLKVGLVVNASGDIGTASRRASFEVEAANAVSRIGALGTYLANFQNEAVRAHYTELTDTLTRIVLAAPKTAPGDLGKLFDPADRLFTDMNNDCVRTAKSAPM